MSHTNSQNLKSPKPNLARNGASSDHLPQSGETLKRGGASNHRAESLHRARFSDNGVATASAAFESSSHAPSPGPRRKRAPVPSTERPDWLPSNWIVEDRMRTSGATAGSVDKYYFDPASGRRFRSKIEVMFFLETGSVRKKKLSENSESDATPSETPGSQKQKRSSKKVKIAPLNFDFHKVPEKIKWALTDSANEVWTPFAGDTKVSESTKQEWVAAFASVTAKNGGRITF